MKGKKGKKTPSPTPKLVESVIVQDESSKEGEFGLDGQKLTYSDANVLNSDQITGSSNNDVPLFIPDDNSSIVEEDESQGLRKIVFLTEDVVCDSLSNPGCSSCGTQQVFLNLTLAGFGLEDISLLESYVHLQKVNLSYNNLSDLSSLSNMKSLIELDVSHNQLTKLLDFKSPFGLRKVDFSNNLIQVIPNLFEHNHLTHLVLSNNKISMIDGISQCEALHWLDLSNNRLEVLSGLDKLQIRYLYLGNNQLSQIENLESLSKLQVLDLQGNHISNLSGLVSNQKLSSLNLAGNLLSDITEIRHIEGIATMRQLNLSGNTVAQVEDYRKSIIFAMQQLSELDGKEIDVEEKVAAVNLFDPPPEVQAALDHITHTVYRFLQPSKIYESTLPSIEMPYPMLVLTGPQGSGKRELAHRLAQEFPDYFGFGVSHTTRQPRQDEQDGKDYHFIAPEHFQALVRQGCFVQTFKHGGALYGLTLDSIEAVAKEGLACVVHMEINGIRTLRNTYFEPRYVLVTPVTASEHTARLTERGVYTPAQMEHIVKRQGANYKDINQEHPGFFDMVINSDKLADAYDRLRQLVMDYLGTSDLGSADDAPQQPRLSTTAHKDETGTQQTNASTNARRTWSRPSFHGESGHSLNDASSARQRSKLDSRQRKTPVEEASYLRRQNAAKEAVVGFSPSVYDELFQRPLVPMTAPGMLEGSPLAQAASMYQDPSFAASLYPNVGDGGYSKGKNGNSDETKSESSDSSTSHAVTSDLSGLSSARGFSDQESARPASKSKKNRPGATEQPLDLTALSDALDSLKGSLKDSSRTTTPLGPRLKHGDLDDWMEQSLPDKIGANVKPVLPPIPTGGM